jgi:hypothetical protein
MYRLFAPEPGTRINFLLHAQALSHETGVDPMRWPKVGVIPTAVITDRREPNPSCRWT